MLVTLVLIGVVAEALQRKTSWIRKRPSAADAVLGAGALSDAAQRLAGDWSQDTPFLLALVALAVVWKHHPLARISIRGARASIHGATAGWRKARTYGAGPAPSRPVFDRR